LFTNRIRHTFLWWPEKYLATATVQYLVALAGKTGHWEPGSIRGFKSVSDRLISRHRADADVKYINKKCAISILNRFVSKDVNEYSMRDM